VVAILHLDEDTQQVDGLLANPTDHRANRHDLRDKASLNALITREMHINLVLGCREIPRHRRWVNHSDRVEKQMLQCLEERLVNFLESIELSTWVW
jgi:hypothetical protein